MSVFRRLRRWFRGEPSQAQRRRTAAQPARNRATLDELTAFATSRHGVEAFLEPRTNMYSTTLLLVADDGEYLRRPVAGPDEAASLCRTCNIPLYDAAKVGYPRRVRDFQQGQRRAPVRMEDLPPWPEDTLPPHRPSDTPTQKPTRDETRGHLPPDADGPPPPPGAERRDDDN
jgi:hypothetical protein